MQMSLFYFLFLFLEDQIKSPFLRNRIETNFKIKELNINNISLLKLEMILTYAYTFLFNKLCKNIIKLKKIFYMFITLRINLNQY